NSAGVVCAHAAVVNRLAAMSWKVMLVIFIRPPVFTVAGSFALLEGENGRAFRGLTLPESLSAPVNRATGAALLVRLTDLRRRRRTHGGHLLLCIIGTVNDVRPQRLRVFRLQRGSE